MELFLAVLLGVIASDTPVEVVESRAGTALSSERQPESPHRIPLAVIDVAKIFKEARDFNQKMQRMKLEIAAFDSAFDSNEKAKLREKFGEQSDPSLPASKSYVVGKKEAFLSDEALVYAETYREIQNAVQRICRERDIGLVIRSTSDSMDPKDRSSVLQGVNRPVVYTAVPDLTADVIAALNKSSK
jgi:Skp family chaperone for outer membrane proteins